VYETRLYCGEPMMRRWDGEEWRHVFGFSACMVFAQEPYRGLDEWRGLAEQPK
jgi:hypothetical protein